MSFTITQKCTRVLVADDDPIIGRLITSILKRAGCTPVLVTDGREAFRILQTDSNFKAAIFDMVMPCLNGLDVIRYMHTEKRLMRIPTMMITSERDTTLMTNSFAAGATFFLPKPFTTHQFQSTLDMLFNSRIAATSG
jgi:CheY-like chemotaxis protein